jgi:predicted transcriptional regulator of viral defense system
MRFEDGKWSMVGETFSLTPDQRRVFEAVPIAPEMAGPKDIAKRCSVNEATVRQIVTRLTKRGVLDRPCPGQYSRFPSHCHLMEKSLETSS